MESKKSTVKCEIVMMATVQTTVICNLMPHCLEEAQVGRLMPDCVLIMTLHTAHEKTSCYNMLTLLYYMVLVHRSTNTAC